MRKAFLRRARERLLEQRRRLLHGIREELKEGRETTKDEGMDTYDLASDARDRDISLLLTDRDREKLKAIEEALERVEDGTYGICESCEAEIAPERLEALPFTRLCVTCQAEQEREAKVTRGAEEDRSFRRLIGADIEEES